MLKILILQNTIMHYRKPFFNELSKSYDITVLHSGNNSLTKNDFYKEIIVPVKKVGPFSFQKNVLKEINTEYYDVVIAMSDIRWVMNMLAVFCSSNVCFFYWGHRYSKNIIINSIRDFFLHLSDGAIMYSDSETKKMINRGMDKSKIFIANNTMLISNSSNESCNKKDSFLFVGRAQKRKKVDELIRAFANVKDNIPNYVNIDIVGEGEENIYLKALAEELCIVDRIIFHGAITDDEKLKKLFSKAFAYVSPGPVGLGVLHSFAYGVPVVTKYTGKHGPEFDNLIHNTNALLYNSVDELKNILIELANDAGLTIKLGSNAFQLYSNNRSITNMVAGFQEAIKSCPRKR